MGEYNHKIIEKEWFSSAFIDAKALAGKQYNLKKYDRI